MKVALITGGTKGIGKAIAEHLLQDGYAVAVTGTRAETVQPLSEELNQRFPDRCLGFISDVRDYADQERIIAQIRAKWGRLDVLIANAGLGHFKPIDEMSPTEWGEVIDINLTGVFNSVKSSIELLKQSKGYVITIASLAGTNFFANGTAYNASKFGLVGFTQSAMLDLRKYGIKVTTIMPGSVATHFNGNIPDDADSWKIQPEDIAQMTMDLLKMPARTLPSKIEVRPSRPDLK